MKFWYVYGTAAVVEPEEFCTFRSQPQQRHTLLDIRGVTVHRPSPQRRPPTAPSQHNLVCFFFSIVHLIPVVGGVGLRGHNTQKTGTNPPRLCVVRCFFTLFFDLTTFFRPTPDLASRAACTPEAAILMLHQQTPPSESTTSHRQPIRNRSRRRKQKSHQLLHRTAYSTAT